MISSTGSPRRNLEDIFPAMKITIIAKRYKPSAHNRPTYFPTSPKTITDTAEHGTSVTRTAVINLSRFSLHYPAGQTTRNITSKSDYERNASFAVNAHFVHQIVHQERDAGNITPVLQ